ncbi:hypothetical protein DYB32_003436 [Aphanomyces invadans]|uniref:Calponin-homology (CH) domain-containing protein n=1 Tax=Aphanomyces invadans TaxID=157072 RepID=A0A418B0S0_9STRA|nr:hypothetical protein DYB32_003436 [Aphanomyces invadans]
MNTGRLRNRQQNKRIGISPGRVGDMSSLLLKWLNEDVQLSQHVECFESDFASGYLLGEILHRSNQQHNFSDFVPSETADAKIVNFSLLEPTMRSLGIKFDAVTATNVMNQQAGVAAKLLYQIKVGRYAFFCAWSDRHESLWDSRRL